MPTDKDSKENKEASDKKDRQPSNGKDSSRNASPGKDSRHPSGEKSHHRSNGRTGLTKQILEQIEQGLKRNLQQFMANLHEEYEHLTRKRQRFNEDQIAFKEQQALAKATEVKKKTEGELANDQEQMIENNETILHLNIGGEKMMSVSKDLLTAIDGSLLKLYFEDSDNLKKIDGKIFIDRDPEAFSLLILYLRNKQTIPEIDNRFILEKFEHELDYWAIRAKTLTIPPSQISSQVPIERPKLIAKPNFKEKQDKTIENKTKSPDKKIKIQKKDDKIIEDKRKKRKRGTIGCQINPIQEGDTHTVPVQNSIEELANKMIKDDEIEAQNTVLKTSPATDEPFQVEDSQSKITDKISGQTAVPVPNKDSEQNKSDESKTEDEIKPDQEVKDEDEEQKAQEDKQKIKKNEQDKQMNEMVVDIKEKKNHVLREEGFPTKEKAIDALQDTVFNSEPSQESEEAFNKWKSLGPFDLKLAVDKQKATFDYNLGIGSETDERQLKCFGQLTNQINHKFFGRAIYHGGCIGEGQLMKQKHDGEVGFVIIFHGFARQIYKQGSYYEGWWDNGKRHGIGSQTYPDGRVKEGLWEKNKLVKKQKLI